MAQTFDYPNINVEKRSNEENMQSTKAYLSELADQLNYALNNLESRIEKLEENVKEK